MNLAALESQLYDHFNFQQSPNTEASVQRRFRADINEIHRRVLGMKHMGRLRRAIIPFNTVANQPYASIPTGINRILNWGDRTNGWNLDGVSFYDIRFDDPMLTSSALPYEIALENDGAATAKDPSTADKLYVISDAAGDGATKTAFVEGIVTGGYYTKDSAAMNGVTAVQIGTRTDWLYVTKFYIALTAGGSTSAVGNITLLQTSGVGTELARLIPGKAYSRYSRFLIHPQPTAISTYYLDCELKLEDMAQATDEFLIPDDFCDILFHGVCAREYRRQRQIPFAQESKGDFIDRIGQLQLWLARNPGLVEQDRARRFSQLGPYFRPGS